MAEFTNICIGIQARTNSSRFPGKIFEEIGGKPMLKHVLDACTGAALYMNRFKHKTKAMVNVAILCPEGDPLAKVFHRKTNIIYGPSDDVLTRYHLMAEKLDADYIVRVTGDCPLIPSYLITKHIKCAIMNQYDYLSNVDENVRTSCDGMDCEVISRAMLEYAMEHATEPGDREHVTKLMRKNPPSWAKIGHVVGYLDLSHLKLSVDTIEDLERVRAAYAQISKAIETAGRLHGSESVHRF